MITGMNEISTLLDRINADFKSAMKSGDKVKLETLRMLRAALKEKEIALRGKAQKLTAEDVVSTIATAAKKRRESIEEFTKAGRTDRAEEEEKELNILSEYLPGQLSEEELKTRVLAVIQHTGADSMKDMGKVMSAVMADLKGRVDGRVVQNLVKQILGGQK
jgi:uncharacterized protein